jgi:four helix bundle protein
VIPSGTFLAERRRVRAGLDQLEDRTKQFAIQAIKICGRLEDVRGLRQLAWQLADAAGSVAANHRAMRRARSTREFAAKLQIVNEEIDESVMWLEIADKTLPTPDEELRALLREAMELRAIFAKVRATTRSRS